MEKEVREQQSGQKMAGGRIGIVRFPVQLKK